MIRKIMGVLTIMTFSLGLETVPAISINIVHTPENTVFVFDFDGVVLTTSLGLKHFKKVKAGTEEIIIMLKSLGYRIDGATNNKKKNVRYFVKKFSVFKYFTKIKCIESKRDRKKPDDEYYKDYMNRFADKTKKYYIFIDDVLDNVVAARRNGFIGIHFKSPSQLYAILQNMYIF